MASEHSITELLPALMDGDSDAVQLVWERFFGNLCRVAYNRLALGRMRGANEEDVAASAFASVCRRIKRGDYPDISSRDDLWRLLVTVTERKALTMLRDEARQKRGGGKVSGESVFCGLDSSQAPGIQAIASADPSPQLVIEITETIGRMFAALDELACHVAMLKLEGHLNDEIASKLGRSRATIERKLKLIRSTWTELEGDRRSDSSRLTSS